MVLLDCDKLYVVKIYFIYIFSHQNARKDDFTPLKNSIRPIDELSSKYRVQICIEHPVGGCGFNSMGIWIKNMNTKR